MAVTASVKDLKNYINQLTPEEKQALALALKKQLLQAEAKRLSSFKPRKSISIQDVIKEVHIVRRSRNAQKNRA